MTKQPYFCFLKYVYVIFLYASFCYGAVAYAQQNDLILRAEALVYSNPDESIKITQHILRTTEDAQEKAVLNLIIAKSFLVKGDYNNAISNAFKETNNLGSIAIKTQIEHHILKASILRKLYLDKQSADYLQKAKELINELDDDSVDALQSGIALEQISRFVDRRENNEAIVAINKVEKEFGDFFMENPNAKRNLYLAKGLAFNNLSDIDSADFYINKTLKLNDSTQTNDLYQKAVIYREIARLHLFRKEFNESEENLFIASRFAEIIDNVSLLMDINKNLSINYLASNKKNHHKVYNDKYLALNSQVGLLEQESLNTLYNMLSIQDESYVLEEEEKFAYYIYVLFVGLFLAGLIGIMIVLKSEARKKRLKEIINYIGVTKNNYLQKKPINKLVSKGIDIPKETEQTILAKLKKFEKSSKYLNKEMSLAVLAGQFETNTKYLSGVINNNYNDNFNTFINKLRVNYIIDKLKNDPNYINYKISFLAEESGYASHSSFATVFKAVVGMSPVTFIKLIQEERKEQESKRVGQ